MSVNDEETNGIGGSGYTLDDLSDYADRGRTPAIAAIDRNAECQAVLHSLERLHDLSAELVDREAAEGGAVDERWLDGILDAIAREFRAGRDVPFPSPDASTTLSVTEGALRELVRASGDSVPGVLIGRSRIDEQQDGHLQIAVTASAPSHRPLAEVAADLRARIAGHVERHSPFVVEGVDVTIVDVHDSAPGEDAS